MKTLAFISRPLGFLNIVLDDPDEISIWALSPEQGMVGVSLNDEDVKELIDVLINWRHEFD